MSTRDRRQVASLFLLRARHVIVCTGESEYLNCIVDDAAVGRVAEVQQAHADQITWNVVEQPEEGGVGEHKAAVPCALWRDRVWGTQR